MNRKAPERPGARPMGRPGEVWAETRKVEKTFVYFVAPKLDPTDKNQ